IDKDSDGKKFTLRLDDKNLVLQKDEDGNWSLHADENEMAQYHISKSLSHDKTYSVVYRKKGEKDEETNFYVTAPKIRIEKLEKPYEVVNIHVAPKIALPDKSIDIYISGEEGEKKKIAVAPHMEVHGTPYVTTYSLQHSDLEQKELKEKLAQITEKLKEIREKNALEQSKESQEKALKEVEEMVQKLSKELKEKSAELKDISLSLHTNVKDLDLDKDENVIVDIKEIEDFNWVEAKDVDMDIAVDIKEGKNIAFVTTDEGEFQINVKAHFDSESKTKYEEIVSKLKKDLPEGYTVESLIDEEGEIFTINIKGTKEDNKAENKIKEILEDLEKQLSKIK
ncbi:MAG: hypothetical protein MUP98_03290, partial [Candidatus Aminicenantes bacterium]|nr:hypothetical protein [Candidatus Aminicenantes bacterium]